MGKVPYHYTPDRKHHLPHIKSFSDKAFNKKALKKFKLAVLNIRSLRRQQLTGSTVFLPPAMVTASI